jgi:hypothetical protein
VEKKELGKVAGRDFEVLLRQEEEMKEEWIRV